MHNHTIKLHSEPPCFEFDAVIIGSGFGGGTLALRLSQAGKRVLVLERGRRWRGQNMPSELAAPDSYPFPSLGDEQFLWGRKLYQPSRQRLGLFELKQFHNLQGMVAAGVGGGSLIWANVTIEAPAEVFTEPWPRGLTRAALEPYYRMAEEYLRPAFVPGTPGITGDAQPIERAALLKRAAHLVGRPWRPVLVAVNFADAGQAQSNGFGSATQMGCNFCTRCSAGCPQNAKNTVDVSYIAEAQWLGAQIRTLHRVCHVAALPHHGYRVFFDRFSHDGQMVESGFIDAKRLILAAGTFGTTELLLRSREAGLLPGVSAALGTCVSINGNVLSGAIRKGGETAGSDVTAKIAEDAGTAIASMIDYGDFVVEDFARPDWAGGIVGGSNTSRIRAFLKGVLGIKDAAVRPQDMLFYVGVGRDRALGRLFINHLGGLSLDWPGGINKEPVLLRLHAAMEKLAHVQGREYFPNVFSTFNRPLTYHPLGGCPMSDISQTGVVDEFGQVFGYPELYIADGSIVPTSLGRNPAFTIAALAERIAEAMVRGWDDRSFAVSAAQIKAVN
jgi:cholesterol oxidase